MKKTGEKLKTARLSKGLSLHEISLAIKVSSKVLQGIEEGDIENLPAKTFLRGFVQSYANYLKVDKEDILKTFQEEMGTTKPKNQSTSPVISGMESSSDSNGDSSAPSAKLPLTIFKIKTAGFLVLIVILVISIAVVKKIIDKYQKEATTDQVVTQQENNSEKKDLPANLPLQESAMKEEKNFETGTDTAQKSNILAPQPNSNISTQSAIDKSKAEVKSTEVKKLELEKVEVKTESVKTEKPKAEVQKVDSLKTEVIKNEAVKTDLVKQDKPKPDSTKAEAAKNEAKKQIELIIEALDKVEIEYSSTSGKSGKIALAPDQVHTFKGSNGLNLKISNGGAVNIILNGKDVGIPGDLGKPISLSY